jgi:pyruvate/2-oxoglutarate dehydrogenase complex dihydrolipoamide acyltransferase (E2) component
MLHEYKLPSLGDGVSGKVTEILVKPGDKVSLEQIVLVVGTDKVDAEMPIDAAGVVDSILVKKGDEVTEGTLVMKIKTEDGSASSGASSSPVAEPAPVATPVSTPLKDTATAANTSTAVSIPEPIVASSSPASSLRTSPLARKRARELGVNLSELHPADGASRI